MEKLLEELLSETKIIRRILSQSLIVSEEKQSENIVRLSSVGIRPAEIAEILTTTVNTVNVALSRNRSKSKKSNGSSQ